MEAGEGLQPTSKGVRVQFSGSQRTVINGPFSEGKDMIAGDFKKLKTTADGPVSNPHHHRRT